MRHSLKSACPVERVLPADPVFTAPEMTTDVPVLAITPGEPSGIGPEILLKLNRKHPEFRLLAVADPDLLRQAASTLGFDTRITQWQPGETISAGHLACFPTMLARSVEPGQLAVKNAPYVLETLRQAVCLVRQGHAAALVTGPVHKGIINDAGVPFTGMRLQGGIGSAGTNR